MAGLLCASLAQDDGVDHRFASLWRWAFFLAARTLACYKVSWMIFRRLAILLAALCWAASAGAQLTADDVKKIITQGASRAQQISPNSVIAVTDREGFVLGV